MAQDSVVDTLRATWHEPFEGDHTPLPKPVRILSEQLANILAKQGVTNELLLELIEVLKTEKESSQLARPVGERRDLDRWIAKRKTRATYRLD